MTRRKERRGEAHVRRRGASYVVDCRIDGRRVRETYATREQAEAAALGLTARKAASRTPGAVRLRPRDVTYAEAAPLVMRWLESGAGSGVALTPRTIATYRQELRWVVRWWGDRRIADYTLATRDAYVEACRADGVSPSQIRHRLDRVAQIHRYARRQGWLDHPLDEVPRPPLRGVARLPLPAAEIERLVAACRDAEELLLILLAADAGLRRVEISRLRRGDVELGEGWHDGVYGWIAAEGKRGRRRSVPILTPALRDALATVCRFRRAPEDQLFRWSGIGSTSHVAAAIAERAGLGRRCLLHRMRHYWISAIRGAGEVGPVTMAWSGHAGTAVHDRYTRPPSSTSHARVTGSPARGRWSPRRRPRGARRG